MFDGRWRHAVDRTTKPVGTVLVRAGVTADVLTIFGLAMSVVTAFAVGSGHLVPGIFLLFPTGLPDLFDGPVAKASGRASVRGAFFDSVADRISDAFLFGGVAWYLAARHHGEMVLLPFAILAVTSLISYQRAKAELLGPVGQGRAHGAGRAFHPARLLLHRRGHLDRRPGARPCGSSSACCVPPPSGGSSTSGRKPKGLLRLVATRAVLADAGHGRHPAGPGPLARRTGGLPLADLA